MSQNGKAGKRSLCYAWSTWMFPIGVWIVFKSADEALMYSEGKYYLLIKIQFLSCQFAVFTACWPAGNRAAGLMKMWTGNNLVLQSEAFPEYLQTEQKTEVNWRTASLTISCGYFYKNIPSTWGKSACSFPQKTICEYGVKKESPKCSLKISIRVSIWGKRTWNIQFGST